MNELDALSLDFAVRHPDSFARVLARGTPGECAQILASLPPDRRAAIIARLPAARIIQLLESALYSPADWLAHAPFDDAVSLLSRIPRDRRVGLVNDLADRERRRQLLRHLQYPIHTVGAIVGDIPLRLEYQSLAVNAFEDLKRIASPSAGPAVVVDAEGRYLGVLNYWKLLTSMPPTGPIANYLLEVKPLRPETPLSSVAEDERWHRRDWLPVVDHKRRVLGSASREKVFRSVAGQHIGARRSYILVELLEDLALLLQTVLVKSLARKPLS